MPRPLLDTNIERLRQAAPLDRREVGIPIALGSQYLLGGQVESAIRAYEEALRIEPRPEIYLNLARAHAMAGRDAQARDNMDLAVKLNPRFGTGGRGRLRQRRTAPG